MITLNLISENLKREAKYKRVYVILKKIFYFLVLNIIACSIILVGSKIILQESFNTIVEQNSLILKNTYSYNNEIKEINTKIEAINKIQGGFTPWTCFLNKISEQKGAEIYLKSVKLNKEKKSIAIEGHAKTRDGLLRFKENLDAFPDIKTEELPIEALLKPADINFKITGELVSEGGEE